VFTKTALQSVFTDFVAFRLNFVWKQWRSVLKHVLNKQVGWNPKASKQLAKEKSTTKQTKQQRPKRTRPNDTAKSQQWKLHIHYLSDAARMLNRLEGVPAAAATAVLDTLTGFSLVGSRAGAECERVIGSAFISSAESSARIMASW